MAGQNVNKPQMLDLLDRLANDDGFRARFEKNPPAALAEIGIAPNQVSGFPEDHTQPGKLAPKSVFETARKQMSEQAGDECFCMIAPGLRLSSDKSH